MSRIISTCAACGRAFQNYDAAPRLWCSVWCETQPARDAETEARGAAAERAAVVAWLRAEANRAMLDPSTDRAVYARTYSALHRHANTIEHGDHRK